MVRGSTDGNSGAGGGDSGGGMVIPKGDKNHIYGVISYGHQDVVDKPPGTYDHPDVYTRVSFHMEWINRQLKNDAPGASQKPKGSRKKAGNAQSEQNVHPGEIKKPKKSKTLVSKKEQNVLSTLLTALGGFFALRLALNF